MLHIPAGWTEGHNHPTAQAARDCEDHFARLADAEAEAEARAEQLAESAWLRAAEYNPRAAEEDARELAYENFVLGVTR